MVVGYEPMEDQYEQLQKLVPLLSKERFIAVNDLSNIRDHQFNKICCLEVLEHLTEANQIAVFSSIRSFLGPNGVVLLSVPIEIGFSGLMKNIVRFLLRQSHQDISLINTAKSFIGMKIERGDRAYISSHVGFDYRDLQRVIVHSGFCVKKRLFSPFPILGGWLNSQVFFVLERRENNL